MDELTFKNRLLEEGLPIDDEKLSKFHRYYELLVEWNQKMNLTAITEEADVYLKHFYDSVTIATDIALSKQTICDVGAGAGFPSIPLKILYPDLKVTIVDSLNKRITFLHHLCEELGLENVEAVAARAEDYAKDHRQSFDLVTARAVARLNILDELCLPLVAKGGCFLALKGRQGDEEINEAKRGIGMLGGRIEKNRRFTLANDDDVRHNIIIRKVKDTPAAYPRSYARIKKRPL
ncbi:MAG: 16S rRNA (guanine(527)-N(7))-methyltransferase RsmG [Erysipelotrichaceae bacterium]|nr:16S rRNA (guanine(527)-N(7))-methyltransferase RsmG [Erysipelotrichaceae bacterium]